MLLVLIVFKEVNDSTKTFINNSIKISTVAFTRYAFDNNKKTTTNFYLFF